MLRAEFSIESIKYPMDNPLIAPGMSVIATILFHATGLAEFDDELTVISEQNAFKVPLKARKELPQLNLPTEMVIQSCWLGDKSEKVFHVKNTGGEAGFKFFCETEEGDR